MLPHRAAPTWLIVLAFAAVYIIWGSTYLAIRWCVETMPPFLMAGSRFLLAGAILLLVLRRFDHTPITPAQWRSAVIVGVLLLVGGNGLVCWAEQSVPSGIAGLLVATTPLWFAMLEWLLFRGAKPTGGMFAGIAIGLFGMYLLLNPAGDTVHRFDYRGVAALFCACFSWALGSLYSRRAPRPASPLLTTAVQMLAGGGALVVVSVFVGDWGRLDLAAITPRAWLAWVYLLIAGSIVAFTAYVWLLRVCSPALVSTYAFVNPLIAVGVGWLAGETPVTLWTGLAMGVVLIGVIVITLSPKRGHADARADATAEENRTEPEEPAVRDAVPATSDRIT